MPVAPDIVATVTARLRAAKRFDRVEVLKRYASLSDPTQIVIVVIVDEGPVSIQRTGDPDHPTRVVRRRWPNLLFFPILGSESGYGVDLRRAPDASRAGGPRQPPLVSRDLGGAEADRRGVREAIRRWMADACRSRRSACRDGRIRCSTRTTIARSRVVPRRASVHPVVARQGVDRLAGCVVPASVRPGGERRSRGRARHAARSLSGARRRVSQGDEKPARLSAAGRRQPDRARGRTDTSGSSARRFWSRARRTDGADGAAPRLPQAAPWRPVERARIQDRHRRRRFTRRRIARAAGCR